MNLADILGMDQDQDWMIGAPCAETDPDAFFPEKGGTTTPAKNVCRSCDVRTDCLSYAMAVEGDGLYDRHGIWGGLSPTERQKRFRERAA